MWQLGTKRANLCHNTSWGVQHLTVTVRMEPCTLSWHDGYCPQHNQLWIKIRFGNANTNKNNYKYAGYSLKQQLSTDTLKGIILLIINLNIFLTLSDLYLICNNTVNFYKDTNRTWTILNVSLCKKHEQSFLYERPSRKAVWYLVSLQNGRNNYFSVFSLLNKICNVYKRMLTVTGWLKGPVYNDRMQHNAILW